jgi:hypothetical protein
VFARGGFSDFCPYLAVGLEEFPDGQGFEIHPVPPVVIGLLQLSGRAMV